MIEFRIQGNRIIKIIIINYSDCGFVVQNHYTSNIYPIIDMDYYNEKFEKRYEQFLNKGYEIKSPAKKNYPYIMEKVYELIMDLYSDFPAFKYIEKKILWIFLALINTY